MKENFIFFASHELGNPLTLIQGTLQLLIKGTYEQKSEKARRMLEFPLHATDRMIQLVNDLLRVQRRG